MVVVVMFRNGSWDLDFNCSLFHSLSCKVVWQRLLTGDASMAGAEQLVAHSFVDCASSHSRERDCETSCAE